MYTNGSYLAKQVMQVPEELILRKDVSELLPVYMLMYAKYSPFYEPVRAGRAGWNVWERLPAPQILQPCGRCS